MAASGVSSVDELREDIGLRRIPVVFICDRRYVIPTSVAVSSLICNKKPDTHYVVYIVTTGLPEEDINPFYEFKTRDTDIHILTASIEEFKDLQDHPHVTTASYLKFDLAELISGEEKALYMDGDVIIQKDLSDLFEINIEKYYAAAVKDLPLKDNSLNIKDYFNTGVMLLNLRRMREGNISAALLNTGRSGYKLTYQDQDCFNICFEKNVKLLPVIYNNFYGLFMQQQKKYSMDCINKYFGTQYASYEDMKEKSYILHLVGYDKPWLYSYNLLTREWDDYFKKSPFQFRRLKRKSIKLKGYALAALSYLFYKYWHNHGFEFFLQKLRKRIWGRTAPQ